MKGIFGDKKKKPKQNKTERKKKQMQILMNLKENTALNAPFLQLPNFYSRIEFSFKNLDITEKETQHARDRKINTKRQNAKMKEQQNNLSFQGHVNLIFL